MEAVIHSTTQIVTLVGRDGAEVQARVWEGRTKAGVPCHFFVARVAVGFTEDTTQFEAELKEQATPSREIAEAYGPDARLVI